MKKVPKILLKLVIFQGIIVLFLLGIPFSIFAYPLYIFNRPLCIQLSSFFAYTLWTLTSWMFNLSSTVNGAVSLGNESYLVISNHLGSVDFILINEITRKSGMMAHAKYAIKDGLRIFPIFYQIVVYLGFLVLKRSFEKDKKKIIEYLRFFDVSNLPIWFVLYPEGSRFTEKLKLESWRYSDKKGMIRLNNVLFPRYKGFKLICEQLRNSRIKKIVDITFSYSEGEVPPLWKFLFWDTKGSFNCDIRTVLINEIDDYEEFLYKSFERKDLLIEKWNSTGK
ncbi:acylglycerol-3-phosphate acyltransferase-like protein [Encephalitozoon intestinalis ATCC 50506]|uniref:Acylglycerol-3-phosphate acyltransferase-like protein n=1 Tax=Encephalitozoon intestinalis (strain ATCC 50506) TaxID=876142 RepID=E0S6T0_ENCIT|nr:acylglycerol-3-phosphate acyltransferase-like protein [Encephalitozoon intestinalis ATCC 50506]ADM11415.1 acylglycerol-3-phosphate acyltransferase-like protein [Encephalitozoon intestinalis ATCC 50506]UTX45107.1 1-acyl-Sn-glycerol-3-phosphate acyltransferase [Encephalitozoon intestinalis]